MPDKLFIDEHIYNICNGYMIGTKQEQEGTEVQYNRVELCSLSTHVNTTYASTLVYWVLPKVNPFEVFIYDHYQVPETGLYRQILLGTEV